MNPVVFDQRQSIPDDQFCGNTHASISGVDFSQAGLAADTSR